MDQISNHEEGDIPMPISSAYVGVLHSHGHHHHVHDMTHHHHNHNHHDVPSLIIPPSSNNGNIDEQHLQLQGYTGNFTEVVKKKVVVKYRECQKNHAATMGGNALDGCGEFMPSGEEGSIEALTCCACNCHRNFHRKEIEGENGQFYPSRGRKVILGSANVIPFTRSLPINMAYHHHDDGHGHGHGHGHDGYVHGHGNGNGNGGGVMIMKHNYGINQGVNKKRFRTKFSQEQKEKMLEFAEKVDWKIQKEEESVVQQFCQEIGVKRRVLKVWMHNNKHSLANKTNNNNINLMIDNNNNNNNNNSSSSI